jgi:two-component system chemotaxis sensor kinase CheA
LFRAGSFERLAVPLSLVARLEEFPRSSIEFAGGREAVQYRNRILPLVHLRDVLESAAPNREQPADPVQVIVFNDGDRSVGVVVDQILDVVEETVMARQKSARKGLLGSAVVGKRVTDLLDLNEVIHAINESWFQNPGGSGSGKTVLVAEGSAFSRGLLRNELDVAGYRVQEAANLDEAIREMERQPTDVVVAAMDLPPGGSSALLAAMQTKAEWARIPLLGLADSANQLQSASVRGAGFQDFQVKLDGHAILESVERLASSAALQESESMCSGQEK